MQIQQAGITLPDEEYYRRKDNDKVRVMVLFSGREDVVKINSNRIEWRLSANFTCTTELIWSPS